MLLGAMRTNCTNQAVLTVLEVGILQRELSMYGTCESIVNFFTLNAFKRSIVPTDFSLFLKCYGLVLFVLF